MLASAPIHDLSNLRERPRPAGANADGVLHSHGQVRGLRLNAWFECLGSGGTDQDRPARQIGRYAFGCSANGAGPIPQDAGFDYQSRGALLIRMRRDDDKKLIILRRALYGDIDSAPLDSKFRV